jgi:hypothetical protein
MGLPPTGSQISINQVQVFYGFTDESQRSLSQLGTQVGITVGNTVSLSATFGGQ